MKRLVERDGSFLLKQQTERFVYKASNVPSSLRAREASEKERYPNKILLDAEKYIINL